MNIYERAKRYGVYFEASCVGISPWKWDQLMKGHTRANKKEVVKLALEAGVIDEKQAKNELSKPWYNPYNMFKTKTHVVYVHSGIEYFIKINQ